MSVAHWAGQFNERISKIAEESLKNLIENKHIYQKINIDYQSVSEIFKSQIIADRETKSIVTQYIDNFISKNNFCPSLDQIYSTERSDPTLILCTVKLHCSTCDSPQAFAPIWFRDIVNELRKPTYPEVKFKTRLPADLQIFVLSYQCQMCHGEPETFIVRRKGWALILEGRSPMEEVEIPKFIPKKEKSLYRDALIATNGGKSLAGFYYLRAFIEQFARRQTKIEERTTGDELMEAYGKTLPEKQRDQMPSLREWYDKLSKPLHLAKDDADLFIQAKEAIDTHFDFRRLFKIPEVH